MRNVASRLLTFLAGGLVGLGIYAGLHSAQAAADTRSVTQANIHATWNIGPYGVVYEFTPKTDPTTRCVYIADNARAGISCWGQQR